MTPAPLYEGIKKLLNETMAENMSNTPDYILAEFLVHCLFAFDKATNARSEWYGHNREKRPLLGDDVPFAH